MNLKKAIKGALNAIGLDVRKYSPRPHPLAWLDDFGVSTVIDAGANVGQFATDIRSVLPHATIYSFEPLVDCFKKLESRFAQDSKFKAFHMALGDTSGETVMNRSDYSPSSSLLPMADLHKDLFPHSIGSTPETIRIARLDEMVREIDLQPKVLLKLDVQGYEDKVIAGAGSLIGSIDAILVETSFEPLYEGQPVFSDIYTMLTALSFEYRGSYQQKNHASYGGVVSEDSIFVRAGK